MKTLFKTLLFGAVLSTSVHAAEVRVLGYGVHAGTEIVFHYTLVNNGLGRMQDFSVGSVVVGNGRRAVSPGVFVGLLQENSTGTLTRVPTGTTWGVRPDDNSPSPISNWPILNPASTTSPAGWRVEARVIKDAEQAIRWTAPEGVDSGVNAIPTGADAGQTLTGFSVRVPANSATGPGAVGTLEPYLGSFQVKLFMSPNYYNAEKRQIFAAIEKQDVLPPTLSVTLTPSTLKSSQKLVPITATITVKDNYDPQPEIKLESITANEPLEKEDIKDAHIGTDDRQFKLKAEREGKNKAGRIYTVTYSATDGSGNKATASATVVVPHDERK